MPIYEYQCGSCGKVNEVMQKIGAEAPESCDKCAKGPLTKLLSKTGFILKGTGWYETDFKGSGSGAKPAASSPPKSDSGPTDAPAALTETAKTETKSEAKPAAGCATSCGHKH